MSSVRDKARETVEWAKGWEGFDDYLKLNAIVTVNGESALVTDPVDITDVRYIDGTADRRFRFMFRMILPWSSGYDGTNERMMGIAESLYDWVVEMDARKEYPKWDGARITGVTPTKSYPEMGYVYEEDGLAEYIVAVEISYKE